MSQSPVWPVHVEETSSFLFEEHYDALLEIARSLRRRKAISDTLLTSDLVHEAFLNLKETNHWESDSHFLASVALSMRHVSIDHYRAKSSKKRGGDAMFATIGEEVPALDEELSPELSIDIHSLIAALAEHDIRQAQIVDCRFFAGFTNNETANILGVDERTVRREWHKARAFLAVGLRPDEG